MVRSTLADLTQESVRSLVHLVERGIVLSRWEAMRGPITVQEEQHLQLITSYLFNYRLDLMNEATIWARAIYPLLLLAESGSVQAWAQVALWAKFPEFELEGFVDGVLGYAISGNIDVPYLIVVEAKRGLEARNPQYQLLGAMLSAAWMNQQRQPADIQEIYGCYTIGDSWTFIRGLVSGLASDRPTLDVEYSREYVQRFESETILQILKTIVRTSSGMTDQQPRAA